MKGIYKGLVLCLLINLSTEAVTNLLSDVSPLDLREGEEDEFELDALVEEVEIKELEGFVSRLTDNQLDNLEIILQEDVEKLPASETDLLLGELDKMGFEEQDIDDLYALEEEMTAFLSQFPLLPQKLEIDHLDISDNVKLYLLGLPNQLGPLGFLALHNAISNPHEDEEEIIDVKYDTEFE